MGQEPLDQRQQKTQEIQKSMPSKIHGTRVLRPKAAKIREIQKLMPFKKWRPGSPGRKAAKSPRNPRSDAFQDTWDKSP